MFKCEWFDLDNLFSMVYILDCVNVIDCYYGGIMDLNRCYCGWELLRDGFGLNKGFE